MMHDELIQQIGLTAEAESAPTADCLDDHQLAMFVEGVPGGVERRAWVRHVAACDHCIARVGRVSRMCAPEVEEAVSEFLLARARRAGRFGLIRGRAPRWAAAAVAVLALALLFGGPGSDPSAPPGGQSVPASEAPQSRTIDPDAMRPRILAPLEGSGLSAGVSLIRWQGLPGSLYYDIRIVSGDGEMIWQDRVTTTEWRLPGDVELAPGEDYFVRVDAILAEARSIHSRHVRYRAVEPR